MEKNTSATSSEATSTSSEATSTSPETTSNSEKKLGESPEKDDDRTHNKAVGHILSVIAFTLAITSYTTTKRGMNDYIFPGVLGVCVSFGVQAMLFCLSLTIPRYWSGMRKIGRRVMAWMLIALILVSSGFTYIYAVNVVYASTDYINSGNIIVKRYNSEIKAAREYVEESLKACRLEMSAKAAEIKTGKRASNESDAPTPTPTSTLTPDGTPTPEGIPSEIDTPAPYTPTPNTNPALPGAVFYDFHDYDTNITAIVVAELDADGYIIQAGTLIIYYFNNQPSTFDKCEEELERVNDAIDTYNDLIEKVQRDADNYYHRPGGYTPIQAIMDRYADNEYIYGNVVEKLQIIKGNIEGARTMLGSNIDYMLNELLTAMLKTDPSEITNKLNELKEKLPSQREMLDSDKYSEIVELLQEASIIAEKYETLLNIQTRLQQLSTSLTLFETSSAEPSSTEPSSVEPSSAEPSSAEPSSAEPSSAEPSSVEPSSAEPWSYSSYLELTAKAQSAYDEIRKIEEIKEDQRTQEEKTIDNDKKKITEWENISIEMIAGLANEIRHISRTELDKDAKVNNQIREYNPITRANSLQNEIRNRVRLEDANKLEMAVRRLADLGGYPLLAWITLVIAFVCDLTALGAGVVNNKLATHNATPARVIGMEKISNTEEQLKLEHKLKWLELKHSCIDNRIEVRRIKQDKKWKKKKDDAQK